MTPHTRNVENKPGISMRYVQHYDISTDQLPTRLDVEILRMTVRPRWKRGPYIWKLFLISRRHGVPLFASIRFAWSVLKF